MKSKIATNYRRWATERLKEYMIKGFAMDDERLKGNGGGNYWKELLVGSGSVSHKQALAKAKYEEKIKESVGGKIYGI